MTKQVRKIFLVVTLLLAVAILGTQYKLNYDINKEPPSQKWAKSKSLGESKVNSYLKIQKEGDKYVLAVSDKKKIKVIEIDAMGNKKKEKYVPVKDEIINNVTLMKARGDKYFLSWDSRKLENNEEHYVILDKELNKVKSGKVIGVNETVQIDDSVLIRAYNEYIELEDLITGNIQKASIGKADFIRGAKIAKDNYLIMSVTGDGVIKYCSYKNSKLTEPKIAAALNLPTGQTIMNSTLGTDNKYAYLLLHRKTKNGFEAEKYNFKLDNMEKYSRKKMQLPGVDEVRDMTYISTEDGSAKFLAGVSRYFGIKKQYEDIAEFYIKDNQITMGDFICKSKNVSSYGAIKGDIAAYCDYIPETESYNVYMTSSKEEFKKENNGLKKEEKSISFQDTLQGFVYSLVYIIVLGIKWILPALMLIGFISFIEYKLSKKTKKILYIATAIMTFLVKYQTIYTTNYKLYAYYLPKQLSSTIVGFFICFLISAVFYLFGYLSYKEDLDAMPVAKFIPYLMLDSIFTLMVFAPFML
ncbi:ABC transporter permease [Clostridium sp. KNHs214]|uniref:ABC transporter permease n=1 Tax=Clostridium sp. KNHs214 TaxID=1540257 RepID=UPI0005562B3C|nr:ABC transporter permease [Clostridium sp. KNHs214]